MENKTVKELLENIFKNESKEELKEEFKDIQKMEIESPNVYDYKKDYFEELNKKVPIYKGCPNKECFCTGACREIIGWRDKIPGEI